MNTENIFGSMMRNPGSKRPVNENVVRNAISKGVEEGHFGLGTRTDSNVTCNYYKKMPEIQFSSDEVIIKNPVVPPNGSHPGTNSGTNGGLDGNTGKIDPESEREST